MPGVLAASLGDETVLLDQNSELYLGLKGVGPRVWELLKAPITSDEIVEHIASECSISPDSCRGDILGFLKQLENADLIHSRLEG